MVDVSPAALFNPCVRSSVFAREMAASRHDTPEDRVTTVWQSIALHSSLGLASRFGTVQSLSIAGISFDIDGVGMERFSPDFIAQVTDSRPHRSPCPATSTRRSTAHPTSGSPISSPAQPGVTSRQATDRAVRYPDCGPLR